MGEVDGSVGERKERKALRCLLTRGPPEELAASGRRSAVRNEESLRG